MKKRLLLAALALVSVVGAFALEVDSYVYNAAGERMKITGENLVANGNFATGLDGWTLTGETAETTFTVVDGEGPNGEAVLKSNGATEGDVLSCVWGPEAKLEGGQTYVVSFQIKPSGSPLTTTVGTTVGSNYIDFFMNGDGSTTHVATTDEAPVVNIATAKVGLLADVWSTVAYTFDYSEGQYVVMHLERLATDAMVTNIAIQTAEKVYDIRIAEAKFAFAKQLMDDPNFNTADAADARTKLANWITRLEGLIEAGEFDDESDSEEKMERFNNLFEEYLDVSSVNMQSQIPGLDIASQDYYGRGGIGSRAATYKLDLSGNWGHLDTEPDALRSAIQLNYAHSATYAAYHEDFPAGKYFFTAEIRNANTGKTSWPTEPVFNLEMDGCKMFIANDSIDLETISGEQYQRFYMIADVDEAGKFRAGVYWPGVSSGGAFFIRNTSVRAFDLTVLDQVEHIQAWKTYIAQWNAAVGARKNVAAKYGNANYPWAQDSLMSAMQTWDPVYFGHQSLGWSTAEGTDAGVASTDELTEWATYQGADPESGVQYQLVRNYQWANNYVVNMNKVITDLGNAIEEAKKTRNKGTNATGDRDTYRAAIVAALNTLTTLRATTTDATREADSTTFANALETLNAATAAFLASVTDIPIVDIDFSNPFTPVLDEEGAESGNYVIKGVAGEMNFGSKVNLENNNTDVTFVLGVDEEYLDVLRVGNGTGTVALNTADDMNKLVAQFDLFVGNLSGKNVYVELQNEAGERVAGFSINRYNASLAYNDFNSVLTTGGDGLNLLDYVTGVGSSSASNGAIAAESNKSHFELTVDYQNQKLQGTLVNGKNATCEGVAMPFRSEITDQKVTKFVLGSNYNNKDRRCWFDNLKVFTYGAGAADFDEDITDPTWAETTGINNIAGTTAAPAGIYSLTGVKLNGVPAKGLYIMNGKKYIVK